MKNNESLDENFLDYENECNAEASKNKLLWFINIIITAITIIVYIR